MVVRRTKNKTEKQQVNREVSFTEEEKVVELVLDILEDIYNGVECIESLNAPQLKTILVYQY